MSENKPGVGGQEVGPHEEQIKRDMYSYWMGERGGFLHELTSMKDPEKFKKSIDELTAVAFGLPCSKSSEKCDVSWIDRDSGQLVTKEENRSLVSTEELMQIFMSPDYMANRKGAGYYAETSLTQVLLGTGRMEVMNGMVGPGKFNEMEVKEITGLLLKQGKIKENEVGDVENRLKNSLKPEGIIITDLIREEAKRFRAQRTVWDAFANHQQTSGDEKGASQLFVTPGHGAPQGPDWKEFFKDEKNHKDKALRQIYAAGLSYEELVRTDNKDYLIEGIHYKQEKDGEVVVLKGNVYAEGWTTEKFSGWIKAILDKTDGDLLAAYDCWYAAITTGLVAKVAVDGVKVGDPPLVSSLDAWLMHYDVKQKNEAGLDENGNVKKAQLYRNKTGPVINIGKYPKSWMGSYFDVARVGEKGKSIFETWWNDKKPIAEVQWIKTDIQAEEEEVRLGSFDGWLYSKFQLFKMLDASQGVPDLKELSGYTYWDGMARSLDKAFGVVYGKTGTDTDRLWSENSAKALSEGKRVNQRRRIIRGNVDFAQVVPDEMNPRYTLFKGILVRYAPMGTLKDNIYRDDSVAYSERFSIASDFSLRQAVDMKTVSSMNPGNPIETFIYSYINSGMLTKEEVKTALYEVYKEDSIEKIYKNSPRLK